MTIRILGDQVFPQAIEDTSLVQLCPLGTTVLGVDNETNLEASYIYASGAASTDVGDEAYVDRDVFTTTLAVGSGGGISCVAMSANLAGQYGWYKITPDVSGFRLVTGDVTLSAKDAGKLIVIDATAGCTVTLPAAVGSGNVFDFLNKTLVTSNNVIIKVANSTDTIIGTTLNTPAADGAVLGFFSEGADDTLTLNGGTKGGFGGARYTFIDFEPSRFYVKGSDCTLGSAVTPFSATV